MDLEQLGFHFLCFESVKFNSAFVLKLTVVFRELVHHNEVCSCFKQTYSEFRQRSEMVPFGKVINS